MSKPNAFRFFRTSPEINRLAVMLYVRFPLSLRNVEDLLYERGTDISHESVRFWWNRFGPLVAAEIRKKRAESLRAGPQWWQHLDEMFVKINSARHYLWWAVDQDSEILESFVTKTRDKKAALKFIRKTLKRYGRPQNLVTEKLRSYRAAMREIGAADLQVTGR
jgi:putative transposase